jgi:glucose/arabinose dehydrogenase
VDFRKFSGDESSTSRGAAALREYLAASPQITMSWTFAPLAINFSSVLADHLHPRKCHINDALVGCHRTWHRRSFESVDAPVERATPKSRNVSSTDTELR